jgi:hypothetical protein
MGKDKGQYAYNYLISKGLTSAAASGIIGNLVAESGLNTAIKGTADNKGSIGIAQWHSGRKEGLINFAKKQGKNYTDLNTQLDYLVYELKQPEYKNALTGLQSAKTPKEAANIFMNKFEKPAEWAKRQSSGKRIGVANAIFNGLPYEGVDYSQDDSPIEYTDYTSGLAPLPGEVAGYKREEETVKENPFEKLAEKQQEENFTNEVRQQQEQQYQQEQAQPNPLYTEENYRIQQFQPTQYQGQIFSEGYFQAGGTKYRGLKNIQQNVPTRRDSLDLQRLSTERSSQLIKLGYEIASPTITGPFPYAHQDMGRSRQEMQKRERDTIPTEIIRRNSKKQPYRSTEVYNSNLYTQDNVNGNPRLYRSQEMSIGVLNPEVNYGQFNYDVDPTHLEHWIHPDTGDGVDNYTYNFGKKYDPPLSKSNLKSGNKQANKDPYSKTNNQTPIKKLNSARPIDFMPAKGKKFQEGGTLTDNERAFLKEYAEGGTVPVSENGVYEYPEQEVIVPTASGRVTMKNVPYPILGIDEYGNQQLMQPNQEYQFPGKVVHELPIPKPPRRVYVKDSKIRLKENGSNVVRDNIQTQNLDTPNNTYDKRVSTIQEVMAVRPDLKGNQGVFFGPEGDQTFVGPLGFLNEVIVKTKPKKKEETADERLKRVYEDSLKEEEDNRLENFSKRSNDLDVKDEPLQKEKDLNTKESILQVQQKLKRAGYNLNPEGKFTNEGLDGKMGKVTRQALEDYNSSGEKAKYTPYKTGEGLLGKCKEGQCSEFVQNEIFRNLKPNVSRQKWNELTGLQGDAWRIGKNIVNTGGKQVNEKEIKPGDAITMYTLGVSPYLSEAKKYGTDATHIGVVDKVNPDGSYYVLHNVHQGNKEDGFTGREYRDLVKDGEIQSGNIKRNFTIRGIYRPNYGAVKDYENKVKVRDDVSLSLKESTFDKRFDEGAKENAKTYLNSLNNIESKKILSAKHGISESEYQSIAKAALGILSQESKLGTSRKLIPKQIAATLAHAVGLKGDEVSKGAGQLKYETNYGNTDLTELGINNDNFTDSDKVSLVVVDRIAENYKKLKSGNSKEAALYKSIEKYNRGSNTKYSDQKDVDYVNKVLGHADMFLVKDRDNIEYNTLADKLNLNKNIVKKQKIFLKPKAK